jgi:hypothetical protein
MANRRYIDFPIASTSSDTDIILIWQDGLNKQTTKATLLSGLPEDLADLNDVVISGLTNGQILRYNSTTGVWENTDQGNLDLNDLNDVTIVSPSNGQVLVYNSSTSQWENSSGGYVPYVGAVTTVDLGAQGLRAGYVRFDTTVASVPDEQGLMYWDDARSTAALIMNGTIQHIGQDSFFYVKNSTGSSINKGVAVRFDGTDGASGHLKIAPFLADGTYPSTYFMGVTAEAIGNGEFGQVIHFGELEGIDTTDFDAGDLLYASTTDAGGFQTTAPVAPNNIVLIAAAVNSKNNGAIIVRPTYGSNINNDEGVKITSVADKNLLQYQSGTSLWENKTIAQVLGGTSSQFVKGDGSLDSTSYQPLLTNPVTGTGTTNYLPKFTGTSTIGNSQVFDNGTNVGIGTSSPATKLSVYANNPTTGIIFEIFNNATSSQTGAIMKFTQESVADWGIGQPAGTNAFAFWSGTYPGNLGTERLRITSSGSVGIGTTSPASILQIQEATPIFTLNQTTGNSNQGIYFNINGTNYGRITNNAATGLMTIQNGLNSGDGYSIRFITDGSERLRITSTGNLLVGTTSDNGARLQVSGTATVSGQITGPSGAVTESKFNFIGYNNAYGGISANTGFNTSYNSVSIYSNFNSARSGQGNASNPSWILDLGGSFPDQDSFSIFRSPSGSFSFSNLFKLASTGAATFSSSVTANGNSNTFGNASLSGRAVIIQAGSTNQAIMFKNSAGGDGTLYINGTSNTVDYNFNTYSVGDALVIKNNGNVGIGTASPTAALHISSSGFGGTGRVFQWSGATTGTQYFDAANTGANLVWGMEGSSGGVLYSSSLPYSAVFGNENNYPVQFGTNNAIRMTLTSGGNVLIGTTTDAGFRMAINGPDGTSYVKFTSTAAATGGRIGYNGNEMRIDQQENANLIFRTNGSTQMTITSGGNVLIGTDALPSSTVEGIVFTGTSSGNRSSSGTSTAAYNHLLFYNGNGLIGYIYTSGSSTFYITSSDYRLKEDLKEFKGLEKINDINVYDYKWKTSNERMHGVLAHELAEVLPYAVTGQKDGEQMQGVDYSKIVPVLIKAIQELKQEIDTLKN